MLLLPTPLRLTHTTCEPCQVRDEMEAATVVKETQHALAKALQDLRDLGPKEETDAAKWAATTSFVVDMRCCCMNEGRGGSKGTNH